MKAFHGAWEDTIAVNGRGWQGKTMRQARLFSDSPTLLYRKYQ